MQHCWPTTPSTVSFCTRCCMLFSLVGIEVVGQSLKPVKLFSPCKHTQHCELLCPFSRSSKCQLSGVSKAYTAMFKRTRHAKAQSESYCESDSFALNKNFPKNLFGPKHTVSVNSDTILYYKLFRFFPSVFSTAQHFQSLMLR